MKFFLRKKKLEKNYGNEAEQLMFFKNYLLEERLFYFYRVNCPELIYRIPIIIEAYRESPNYLFGDLDNNYGTNMSTKLEKKMWNKENIETKRVRVRVAQHYIYRSLKKNNYLGKNEYSKYKIANSY